MIVKRKTIKIKDKIYNLNVNTYSNGRIRLQCRNTINNYEITLNLENVYLENDKVFLNPVIQQNGIMKVLRKNRIIKEICGTINYNDKEIPIAILNMGIIKSYDYNGVCQHLGKATKYE